MLNLPENLRAEIEAHSEAGYPDEVCGFLIGSVAGGVQTVAQVLPVENMREDRARRFEISGADYYAGEQAARGRGLSLLGFYHSHPDCPAVPSAYDLERAQELFPGYAYLIVGVENGRAVELTSWVLRDDGSQFDRA